MRRGGGKLLRWTRTRNKRAAQYTASSDFPLRDHIAAPCRGLFCATTSNVMYFKLDRCTSYARILTPPQVHVPDGFRISELRPNIPYGAMRLDRPHFESPTTPRWRPRWAKNIPISHRRKIGDVIRESMAIFGIYFGRRRTWLGNSADYDRPI